MDDALRRQHEALGEHREYLLTVVWRNGAMTEKVVGSKKMHDKVEGIRKDGLQTHRFEKAKLFWEIIPFHEITKIVVEEQ